MVSGEGSEQVRILLAEDDDDDYFLTAQALKENRLLNEVMRVKDGEELMHYLRGCGEFSSAGRPAEPSLVLLDLNMPKMDGREALREIKSDPKLRHIPVVVLTTSRAEEDVVRSYELGVNSFITKPVTFQGMVDAMKTLGRYWFEVVELPT
jgi:CheY-like chemotaxis protein